MDEPTDIQQLLKSAIMSLCVQSFSFQTRLSVEASIVVTLDDEAAVTLSLQDSVMGTKTQTSSSNLSTHHDNLESTADVLARLKEERDADAWLPGNSTPTAEVQTNGVAKVKKKRGRPRKISTVEPKRKHPADTKGREEETLPEEDVGLETPADVSNTVEIEVTNDSDIFDMTLEPLIIKKLPFGEVTESDVVLLPAEVEDVAVQILKQDGVYKCTCCQFSTTHGTAMQTHMTVHTKNKSQCTLCFEEFSSSYLLKKHMETHELRYVCKVCCEGFTRKSDLHIHHRLAHVDQDRSQCPFCSYTTKKEKTMTQHMKKHKGDQLTCDKCEESFQNLEDFHQHNNREHRVTHKVICHVCAVSFPDENQLLMHEQETHQIKTPGFFRCAGCSSVICSEKNYLKHRAAGEEGSLKCNVCDLVCICKKQLASHMKLEHPLELKKKVCEFCSKEFQSKQGLYTHRKVVHSSELGESKRRSYTCHICGKSFPVNVYLTRHLRSHEDNRPYECPKCLRSFKYHGGLKTHKQSCLNSSGYPCEYCGKRLKSEWTLRIHIQTMHTENYKKHKCRKCGEMFKWKPTWTKHEQTCNGKSQQTYYVATVDTGQKATTEENADTEIAAVSVPSTDSSPSKVSLCLPSFSEMTLMSGGSEGTVCEEKNSKPLLPSLNRILTNSRTVTRELLPSHGDSQYIILQ